MSRARYSRFRAFLGGTALRAFAALLPVACAAGAMMAQLPPAPAAPVTSTTDWQKWKDHCASVTQQFGTSSLIACASSAFTSRVS